MYKYLVLRNVGNSIHQRAEKYSFIVGLVDFEVAFSSEHADKANYAGLFGATMSSHARLF